MEVSVVMAARDEAAHIGEAIDALLAQDAPFAYELIVADNGSTDATPAIADSYADSRVRLLDASRRA